MSYSLQIKSGDLNLGGPGGLAVVTGTQKLVQDLRNWILEAQGTDPMHPEFGSTLDGEIMPDGSYQDNFIGTTIDSFQILNVEAELRRILYAYQQNQVNKLQAEQIQYSGKNTFAAGEILYSIDAVDIQQLGDVLVAHIQITTDQGTSVSLTQPVS